jgi:hypothetical protein
VFIERFKKHLAKKKKKGRVPHNCRLMAVSHSFLGYELFSLLKTVL